jgi:serine/threonine-protein kinase
MVAAPVAARRPWTLAIASGVVCAAVAAVTAVAMWLVLHQTPQKLQPMRFSIVPPATEPFNIQGFYRNLAISPDGTHVVYVAGTESQLMVRAIDQLDAVPLRGITNAAFPFVSPDGRWVGFSTGGGGEIKKVSIAGGPPITLCRYTGTFRGASWGPDDTIVFASNDTGTGLFAVPAGGGEPKLLTKPDGAHDEVDHLFPFTLPGGRAVLFTITTAGSGDSAQVAVLDLKTGQRKTLVRGGSDAVYLDPSATSTGSRQAGSGQAGYLVYASAGTLRAVRFDPARLEVLSDPVPVLEQVTTLGTGAADFRVSQNGTLVYVPGTSNGGITRSLVWVNRQGREEPINAPPRGYTAARLSPDGTRVALEIRDQENDIWIWDLGRQTLTRLTFDPRVDSYPLWTPDGKRIVFGSDRAGASSVYWQAADGTGTVERLITSPSGVLPTSIAPDAKSLVVQEANPKTSTDVMLLALEGTRRIEPLVQTTFSELGGQISPDGHWLAYYSNESGRPEVYVRPFPKVEGGRWQISTGGGSRPAWSAAGRELFFLQGLAMMAVAVQTAPTFSAGNPSKLFDGQWFLPGLARPYDVSRDGQRFLMIKDATNGGPSGASPTITVVLNWFEELKARVPAK